MTKPYNIVTSATGPPRAGDKLAESLPLRPVQRSGLIQQRGGRAVQVSASAAPSAVVVTGGGGGGGTSASGVTSAGLTLPTTFTVTGSPITGSGTIVVTWQSVPQNFALLGPVSGGAGAPTFRAFTAADVPASAAQKRRLMITFYPASSTADTAANITQVARLPKGTGGVQSQWKFMLATLRIEAPNASATTAQVFYVSNPGNAAFGSGTAALTASATASGTTVYEASVSAFTGSLATAGLPSGSLLAPQFSALGGTNASLEIEMEEV